MVFTSTEPIQWLPMFVFAFIVALITILIGKFLFKRKPIWIFAIPTALIVAGGAIFGIGLLMDTWDAIAFLLYGVLFLLAGGGSIVGALVAYFLILKGHRHKLDPDDVFSR